MLRSVMICAGATQLGATPWVKEDDAVYIELWRYQLFPLTAVVSGLIFGKLSDGSQWQSGTKLLVLEPRQLGNYARSTCV